MNYQKPQAGDLCIVVRQPWAFAIIRPDILDPARSRLLLDQFALNRRMFKDVENRSWSGEHYRGPCWVLAAKGMTRKEFVQARTWMEERGLYPHGVPPAMLEAEMARGVIIGSIELAGKIDKGSPWYVGASGFAISSPMILANPIPYKGQLGFFRLKAEGLPK